MLHATDVHTASASNIKTVQTSNNEWDLHRLARYIRRQFSPRYLVGPAYRCAIVQVVFIGTEALRLVDACHYRRAIKKKATSTLPINNWHRTLQHITQIARPINTSMPADLRPLALHPQGSHTTRIRQAFATILHPSSFSSAHISPVLPAAGTYFSRIPRKASRCIYCSTVVPPS